MTLEAWIKIPHPVGAQPILSIGKAGAVIELVANQSGNMGIGLDVSNSTTHSLFVAGLLQPDTWQHIAVTIGPGGQVLYLNGHKVAEQSEGHDLVTYFQEGDFEEMVSGAPVNPSSLSRIRHWARSQDQGSALPPENSIMIGISVWGIPEISPHLKGSVDEIRIWSTVRTETQIQASLRTPVSKDEPGLTAHWNFDDGTIKNKSKTDFPTTQLVRGDEGKLRQILINLMGNAVKFTQAGHVQPNVHRLESNALENNSKSLAYRFEVKDTGAGISKEAIEKLFQPFQQGKDVIKQGGTGLGLAIAKRQLSLMNSELEVDSTIGRGSCFHFQLTFEQATKSEISKPLQSEGKVITLSEGYKVQVLVVDDVEENRDVLCHMLEGLGCTVEQSSNGTEALTSIEQSCPDIIFMDIRMPGMNGFEVCTELKKDPETEPIPVIFITANDEIESLVEGFRLGAVDFISKPIKTDEVRARTKTHLKLHLMSRSLSEQNRALMEMNAQLSAEMSMRQQAQQSLSALVEGDTDLFHTYGPLKHDAPSYVEREADHALFHGLSSSEFCYVLTSRQMGKSSLMARVSKQLSQSGKRVVTIDLTALGQNLSLDQWYDGLLARIGRSLDMEDELDDFWLDQTRLSSVQRFFAALREVVLERIEDIPLLADHFLRIYAIEMALTPPSITQSAMKHLCQYPFPGNVRELKNTMERALVESGGSPILPEHLHFFYGSSPSESNLQSITNQNPTPSSVTQETDEACILKHVSEKGSINNTACRALLQVERHRASYLLKKLHGIGNLRCEGSGRWAVYVLPTR